MSGNDPQTMSTEELLRAIDYYLDTGTNLTTHGQADDYMIASLKMAELYQEELDRREREHKRRRAPLTV